MTTPAHVPTGEYPAAAPVHLLDLENEADRLVQALPGRSRQTRTLAREGGVSVLMMAMEAGDVIKEHSAKGTVSIRIVRGHAVLTSAGERYEMRPAQMVVIQPGVPHDLRAEEQTVVVLSVAEGVADG